MHLLVAQDDLSVELHEIFNYYFEKVGSIGREASAEGEEIA